MKNFLLFFSLLCAVSSASAQTISIAQARLQAEASTVTVKGIVTNGSEFGNSIRYIQDETAGIAVFNPAVGAATQAGDSLLVTGQLAYYNNLIEITGGTFTVINTGNPLPSPAVLAPSVGFADMYEGQLVSFDNVSFSSTGNFGTSSANYNLTDGTNTYQVRVNGASNIAGTPIPSGTINITGVMSQFSANDPATGFQLLPRSLADFDFLGNPPIFTTTLQASNLTTNSVTVGFETQNPGTTVLVWGTSPTDLTLGSINDASLTTSHSANLTGLQAGTIYYIQATTVSATGDESVSAVQPVATVSLSSGDIKVYFNRQVDNTVSSGTNAIYVNQQLPDTLVSYFNRAEESIDICFYSYDNDNQFTEALQAAVARGVTVRIAGDDGIDAALWASLPGTKTKRPGALNGIMHNKFLVIDANSANPNKPIVWTGGTNFTDNQMTVDANNVIIFQDQSLARAYTIEFEEMVLGNKFGPQKTDNTPKEFLIGGKRVELYFSPTDLVNPAIQRVARSAQNDLYFAILAFTRTDIAYAFKDASEDGALLSGIMDADSDPNTAAVLDILQPVMGNNLKIDNNGYIFHHKYLIADPTLPTSDPTVLTGSHNWSNAAQFNNDENTVVVHDATIANIFYQEWMRRYTDNGGVYVLQTPNLSSNLQLYPNPASSVLNIVWRSNSTLNYSVSNIMGQMMQSGTINANQTQQIDTNTLPKGMYIVQIGTEAMRFVVQ